MRSAHWFGMLMAWENLNKFFKKIFKNEKSVNFPVKSGFSFATKGNSETAF